jgi:hypothetical protein
MSIYIYIYIYMLDLKKKYIYIYIYINVLHIYISISYKYISWIRFELDFQLGLKISILYPSLTIVVLFELFGFS